MRQKMRHKIKEVFFPRLNLPKHMEDNQDVYKEIDFFVKAYKKAKTLREKNIVINGLMYNAKFWDFITRSMIYYPGFERAVKKHFPKFWMEKQK